MGARQRESRVATDSNPYQELSDALVINKHNLDEDLIRHPVLFQRVGFEFALAVSRRDERKQAWEEQQAMADDRIRRKHMGDKKPSEPQIANMVMLDAKVQEASSKYLKAKLRAEKWLALRSSYEQRGYALKDLGALHTSGYFANMTGVRERNQATDRKADKVRKETGDKRSRHAKDLDDEIPY